MTLFKMRFLLSCFNLPFPADIFKLVPKCLDSAPTAKYIIIGCKDFSSESNYEMSKHEEELLIKRTGALCYVEYTYEGRDADVVWRKLVYSTLHGTVPGVNS